MIETFQTVRALAAAIGAFLCFGAGHSMRVQGSGVNFSYGLVAYAAGFGLLAYAASGAAEVARQREASRAAARSDLQEPGR